MARPRVATDLARCFRNARVLTVEELCRRLSVSRATAFRRLAEHGYFSSYNHRGRYLTIEEVARFDPRGLWCFKNARFSRHGTLKLTVERFVVESRTGMTQEELSEVLGVQVHNSLLDLVQDGAIGRVRLGSVFLYVSPAPQARQAQIAARGTASEGRPPRPGNRQVIAVLLVLVEHPEVGRVELVRRCRASGVDMTRAAVDAIFTRYDLDKKRAR